MSRVLLLLVEDGQDLGQGMVAADVADEDDAGHADGLGYRVDRPEHEMTLGNSWPTTSAARMPGGARATLWEVIVPLAMTQAGSTAAPAGWRGTRRLRPCG